MTITCKVNGSTSWDRAKQRVTITRISTDGDIERLITAVAREVRRMILIDSAAKRIDYEIENLDFPVDEPYECVITIEL